MPELSADLKLNIFLRQKLVFSIIINLIPHNFKTTVPWISQKNCCTSFFAI